MCGFATASASPIESRFFVLGASSSPTLSNRQALNTHVAEKRSGTLEMESKPPLEGTLSVWALAKGRHSFHLLFFSYCIRLSSFTALRSYILLGFSQSTRALLILLLYSQQQDSTTFLQAFACNRRPLRQTNQTRERTEKTQTQQKKQNTTKNTPHNVLL